VLEEALDRLMLVINRSVKMLMILGYNDGERAGILDLIGSQSVRATVVATDEEAMKGDREKCIEAGASDYITKPIDTHYLLSLLQVWLCHRRSGS
jgi:CheY-like chemotaxis protein